MTERRRGLNRSTVRKVIGDTASLILLETGDVFQDVVTED